MEYRQLGKSDLLISRTGFGTMSLQQDENAATTLIPKAIDLGINYFDTADLYNKGANEIIVGKAIREHRKKIILATKVGNQWRSDGSGWDWNPGKKYILDAVEQSLRRLGTDYIDLYQLHGGTIDDPIDETIEAFEALKQAGKIRHYGISSIRPNVIREWIKRSGMVSVMMQYSLLDRRPEKEMLSLLLENKIGVLARGSVAQGLLVNKTPKPYLNYSEDEISKVSNAVERISDQSRTKASVAIQYVLQHPAITSAIVGIRSLEQLEDAVAAVEIPRLQPHEINNLNGLLPPNQYTDHL
jgi:aryl-alcohol dehydrogenase-like predicted oxidoreductase